MLLPTYPNTAEAKNEEGDLPLHQPCEKDSLDVIKALLIPAKGLSKYKTTKGSSNFTLNAIMLIQICRKKISFHIMKMLVMTATDIYGRVALDHVRCGKSEEICSLLPPQVL
jgi:hypothetical protein